MEVLISVYRVSFNCLKISMLQYNCMSLLQVGSLCACFMARRGYKVELFEMRPGNFFLNKNHGVQYSSTDYWRIAQCQFLIFKQKMFWPLSSLVDRQWPLNLFEIRWTLFELTSGICDLKLSPKTFSLSLDTIFSVLRQQMLILPKWICTILTLYKCFSFILRMLYR